MSPSAVESVPPILLVPSTAQPTPSPDQIDPAQSQLARWIESLQQVGNGINQAIHHAAAIGVHAAVILTELAIAVSLVGLATWLALRLAAPRLRRRLRRARQIGLHMLPPIESSYHPEAWVACFQTLYAIAAPWWKSWLFGQPSITFEYRAQNGRVSAHCWCPEDLLNSITSALRTALPGLELLPEEDAELPRLTSARARLQLWREPLYPIGAPRLDALASAASALSAGREGLIQFVVAPDTGWERRAGRRLEQLAGGRPTQPLAIRIVLKVLSLPLDVFFELFWNSPGTHQPATTSPSRPLGPLPPKEKAHEACWRAEVRLCCWADQASIARQDLRPVAGAFQALDGANRLRVKRVWWGRSFDSAVARRLGPSSGNLVLSAEELTQLCHLPLGGVPMDAAHVHVAPQRPLGHVGSLAGRLEDEARTPVRIAQTDRRQHLWVVGPTGSGKSTLLLNLAVQDIEAGLGVGVIDPKGDLIRDLLERIPAEHQDRLVLFDPSQRERPLGLNVLDCEDEGERELVTDGVVSIFRKTFERFWGPRTDDILRVAVLTLLRHPGATLCEVPLLLLNRDVRARLTKQLDDPIGLRPFWQEYEAFTDGQRAQMVGPVLNKLRSFLLRPTVRNVLGQSRSSLDLAQVMDRGGILLVNLSKGALGEESSRLLGAFIISRLWQTALRRARRPESWRPDFNLYLDEFQNYLHLPQALDDVLAEARAYRLNLTLANQHLGQLRDGTRQAVEANARSKVVFQTSQEDARHLAREFSPLTETHLERLDLHQVAVRLCVDGHTEAAFTAVTEPASAGRGAEHAAELATQSLLRHGRPRSEVEAEIQSRLAGLGYRGDFKEIA